MSRKPKRPSNVEESLIGEVNRLSKECRSIAFGIQREACFVTHVLPRLNQLQAWGYSVEWDIDKKEYMLVELVKDEREWVHPTIILR